MTETELRQKMVGIMRGWLGRNEADGSHKAIIDIYNRQNPLPSGYRMTYKDAWCAATVSAAALTAGLSDIIPPECSCSRMITLLKKINEWEENDAYRPSPGDLIFYDWQDSGSGDNTGAPDHVGVVETVSGDTMTIIEGNYSKSVKRRSIRVNGRYIRGFGVPHYAARATAKATPNQSGALQIGDLVRFTGTQQFTSSYSGAASKSAGPCSAKVTNISAGRPHPYHLVGSKVYGWVNAADIKGAGADELQTGDTVKFTGKVHYTSSYAGARSSACTGGEATVTAINRNGAHPYCLKGRGCTVEGWVDASDVTR